MSGKKEKEGKLNLEDFLASMNSSFGEGSVMILGNENVHAVECNPVGVFSIDDALGGGFAKGRIIEIYGPESSGKAQPLYSNILTPKGFVKMGDVKLGQEICTPDGEVSTITGIFPQGKKGIYEVTFDDKSKVRCCKEHLWFVNTRYSDLGEVMSLEQIIKHGVSSEYGVRKFKVPTINPVKFSEESPLPLDPYLFGFLLGDGCNTRTSFSTADEEILTIIQNIIDDEDYNLKFKKLDGSKYDYGISKKIKGRGKNIVSKVLFDLYLKEKGSHEKFIPDIYKFSSVEDRISLIQGLMDSDGSANSLETSSISFSTTSLLLSKDFEFVMRSLGFRVTTSDRITKYTNGCGKKVDGKRSYRSSILSTNNIIPFRLTRKKEKFNHNVNSNYCYRFIESIDYIGEEEAQCIMIGHPDHLYITDEFIPTHNTSITLMAIAEAQKKGKKCGFIDVEQAFDANYAQKLGVNLDQLAISQPDYGEQALEILDRMIESAHFDIIVFDSIAAITPKAELEGEMGEQKMGVVARLMAQALRKITAKTNETNTTVIFINQLREKLGIMFGNPETTTGGNAMKFYASQRIDIRKGTLIKDGEDVIGYLMKVKVIKNKIAAPFKEAHVDVMYNKGVDKIKDIIDFSVKKGVISKAGGGWMSYGDTKLGQGADKVAIVLNDNPELMEEIISKIKS